MYMYFLNLMEVSFDSSLDEGGDSEEQGIWDNVKEVNSTFISKRKSKAPGMLSTHNMQYKFWFKTLLVGMVPVSCHLSHNSYSILTY